MRCTRCGHDNDGGGKFCAECGARLGAARTPGEAARGAALSPALPGERKQVTVLFADLQGSLELLAGHDPEHARAVRDAALERMRDAVHRFDGTVNQVVGDGIMALFGAPVAHEDHAVRACYAALRMHRNVARDAAELRRQDGIDLQICVGISSGEVVVREIGSDLRTDSTAVGEATHLAARMEQLARPGTTLVSAATRRLAGRAIDAAAYGPVAVQGLAMPVEVFELRAAIAGHSRLQAISARAAGRLLGRDAEMAMLAHALERGASGGGRCVAIRGEPGVGKSRLVWELAHGTLAAGWHLMEGSGVDDAAHTPYGPFRACLATHFGIEDGDDPRAIRDKAARGLIALDPTLAGEVPAILALGNVPVDDLAWRELPALQVRQRIFSAVTQLLRRESARHPVLLVLENLHWMDAESLALLDALAAQIGGWRVVVLTTERSDTAHCWPDDAPVTTLPLEPLSAGALEALLDGLLGADPSLAALRRDLAARSEGNPLFLEETTNDLAESGALTGSRGAYRLARPGATVDVPPRVEAIIAARIERLAPATRQLLLAAAAVGMEAPVRVLEAAVDAAPGTLAAPLMELQFGGFLRVARLYPDAAYAVKHALTRDVAYTSLLEEQRRAVHGRILDALLSAAPHSPAVERLAHHALRAERWSEAVDFLRHAGDAAASRSANHEAVALLEQALTALRHLPETAATLGVAIDVRLDLRPSLLQLGRLDAMLTLSKEAEELAERLGDDARLGRVYGDLVSYHYLRGHHGRAADYGERCLELAERRQDRALATLARRYLGQSQHARGDVAAAVQTLESVVLADTGSSLTSRVTGWGWLALALADLGQFDRADTAADRARALAGDARHPDSEAIAETLTAFVWLARGQHERAVPPLERALALCRSVGLDLWQPVAAAGLGVALARAGRHDEGVALLDEALRDAEALGVRAYLSRWTAYLAEALLLSGQPRRASAVAEWAIELASAHAEEGHQAEAHAVLAAIAARDGADEGFEHAARALALAGRLGLRPLAARTRLSLASLHRVRGNATEAEDHLARAMFAFSTLGMRAWLERTEPELRALGNLVIVARGNLDLYEYLTQKFAGDTQVKVILDRRRSDRRQVGAEQPATERRRLPIDDKLRDRGLAVLIEA